MQNLKFISIGIVILSLISGSQTIMASAQSIASTQPKQSAISERASSTIS
jgi:hypothetical protein